MTPVPAVFVILPGPIMVDVVDHIVRARAIERGVSGATSMWSLVTVEMAGVATTAS